MKFIAGLVLIISTFTCFDVYAVTGPTTIGNIVIGMSKAEYISSIGIHPVDCNTYKGKDGKSLRSGMTALFPDSKTLCMASDLMKKGSIENIQVSGIAYDVIEANYDSSKVIDKVGNSSKAIFFKDRLISLEIAFPKVGIESLTKKYGEPNIVDKREVQVCQNRIGNEFKNKVGKVDAVWTNGDVEAKFRAEVSPPEGRTGSRSHGVRLAILVLIC